MVRSSRPACLYALSKIVLYAVKYDRSVVDGIDLNTEKLHRHAPRETLVVLALLIVHVGYCSNDCARRTYFGKVIHIQLHIHIWKVYTRTSDLDSSMFLGLEIAIICARSRV